LCDEGGRGVAVLGDALRARCEGLGLTHAQAAETIGTVGPNFTRWVSGESEPSGRFYDGIARFLDVDEPELALLVLRDRMVRSGVKLETARSWRRAHRDGTRRTGDKR
jgi:transcriptional regulator with XRE-family HTH domain